MRFLKFLTLGLLLCSAPAFAAGAGYNFPYTDPLVATILGSPPEQRVPLVEDIPVRLLDLTILPGHQVPDIFWYNGKLRCSLAWQKQKAPLIFLVAGTGAGFNSDKMLALQSIFYRAGFHVVSLSSPTHANFITAASGSATPGVLRRDARDLYRVMQKVYEVIRDDIEVSAFHLAGYSLGGTQAAFVSQLDEEAKVFNFSRVLMINPAVSLYNSATRLDSLLDRNVPGGAAGAGEFLREQMNRLAQIYSASDFVKFDNEFLYNIYRNAPEPPRENNLAALIGISFRISAVNMMFATDVMTRSGFVVPKEIELDNNDPLDDYFRTLTYISFARYLDELLLPIAQAGNPQVTRQQVIDGSSLTAIEDYLLKAEKLGVVTSADDIILDVGELDYLRKIFGDRATIYPTGGHCGNLDHHQVADFMTAYFGSVEVRP
jgi:pimeloyl-ACP methyl ester carboxylesterase